MADDGVSLKGADTPQKAARDSKRHRFLAESGLPEDISFLASYGFSPDYLIYAAKEARRLDIEAHEVVLSSGSNAERHYYRALADHLRLPFLDKDSLRIRTESFAASLLARPWRLRILPVLSGGKYLYAAMPRGTELRNFLKAMRRHDRPERVAIAAPCDGRAALMEQAAGTLAQLHVSAQSRERPDLSAAGTPQRIRRLVICTGTATTLAAAAMATLTGAAAAIGTAIALCLAAIFGMGLGLRLAVLKGPAKRRSFRIPDRDLPVYSVLVPVYREARIIPQLLTALSALSYPSSRLEILVLLEADDPETLAAIKTADPDGRFHPLILPPGQPRTKPRALQLGLAFAHGALVTVFDAEDMPATDQLRLAAERFLRSDDQLACLQAKLVIDNSHASWLSRQFALEYGALFHIVLPGLARLGLPVMLGGTSNHFRAEALRQVKGWDAWNVTEDADLGLRLARFGYRIEALDSTTEEEAPASLKPWFTQRRRWLKGWMQTALVHLSDPARLWQDLSAVEILAIFGLLVSTLLAALIYPFSLIGVAILAIVNLVMPHQHHDLPIFAALSLFFAGHGIAAALIVKGARPAGLKLRLRDILGLPVYWALVSLAGWSALIDLARRPFHWDKTSHLGRVFERSHPSAAESVRIAEQLSPWPQPGRGPVQGR